MRDALSILRKRRLFQQQSAEAALSRIEQLDKDIEVAERITNEMAGQSPEAVFAAIRIALPVVFGRDVPLPKLPASLRKQTELEILRRLKKGWLGSAELYAKCAKGSRQAKDVTPALNRLVINDLVLRIWDEKTHEYCYARNPKYPSPEDYCDDD